MPRKKNKRKAIQKARQKTVAKPRVGIIAHTPYGASSAALAMALVAACPQIATRNVVENLTHDKEQADG